MALNGLRCIFRAYLQFMIYHGTKDVKYGDIYHQNEVEQSRHNFELSNAEMLLGQFNDYENECKTMLAHGMPWPAYDYCLKCSILSICLMPEVPYPLPKEMVT